MRLFSKALNIIYEDMIVLFLPLSNLFDNGRTKYTTYLNGWSIYHPFMHIIVVIIIIRRTVGNLGQDLFYI